MRTYSNQQRLLGMSLIVLQESGVKSAGFIFGASPFIILLAIRSLLSVQSGPKSTIRQANCHPSSQAASVANYNNRERHRISVFFLPRIPKIEILMDRLHSAAQVMFVRYIIVSGDFLSEDAEDWQFKTGLKTQHIICSLRCLLLPLFL